MVRAHAANVLLALLFLAQLTFGWWARDVQSFWTVLPPAPTRQGLDAQAFGDPEFLYRSLVMDVQNFGDTGGRSAPLRDYDMSMVVKWLQALDHLDIDANHHLQLAAQYFSQTQNHADVEPLVRYIKDHVAQNPEKKLQWLREALFLAQIRLKDTRLTLEIADQLAQYDFPVMNVLAYQLPALVYEKAGDYKNAVRLMRQALDRLRGRAPQREIDFMEAYVKQMEGAVESQKPGQTEP